MKVSVLIHGIAVLNELMYGHVISAFQSQFKEMTRLFLVGED